MKFKCGKWRDSYREWLYKRAENKSKKMRGWHRWFAWRPVKVEHHDCRLFEFVWRRYPNCYWEDCYPLPFSLKRTDYYCYKRSARRPTFTTEPPNEE